MILHQSQKIIAKDTHRFRICCNGRRWGKTTLAIEEIKGKALSGDKRIAYIAPNFQQARDIAWEALKKELNPIIIAPNESRLELRVKNIKGGESLIVLRGWEAVETLRGQFFDFIVIDEVASMRNFNEKWQEVVRPTLTDKKGECLFISTPRGFNHFYDLYNFEKKDPDYKSFHFTSYDNPFIPKDEIDKARMELTEDRFHQEYLADFRKTEGLVYKEFDRDVHLFSDRKLIKGTTLTMLGVDFGFSHPTAIMEIHKDFDGTFWVVSEWVKSGKTNAEAMEYAKTINADVVYPDPEDAARIEDWQRAGFSIRLVDKDVEKGIDTVRTLLKSRKLMIHESCNHLIDEFQTYSYQEPPRNDKPIKENDDALDGIRYCLYNAMKSQSSEIVRRQSMQNTNLPFNRWSV